MEAIDDQQLEGSGFSLQEIVKIKLEVYKVEDIQASSYIPLPEKYKTHKSIINIQNKDNHCFLWCILAHQYPAAKNEYRISNYERYKNTLNTEGLKFPMKIKDIPKFERRNNLNINVFEPNELILTPA